MGRFYWALHTVRGKELQVSGVWEAVLLLHSAPGGVKVSHHPSGQGPAHRRHTPANTSQFGRKAEAQD